MDELNWEELLRDVALISGDSKIGGNPSDAPYMEGHVVLPGMPLNLHYLSSLGINNVGDLKRSLFNGDLGVYFGPKFLRNLVLRLKDEKNKRNFKGKMLEPQIEEPPMRYFNYFQDDFVYNPDGYEEGEIGRKGKVQGGQKTPRGLCRMNYAQKKRNSSTKRLKRSRSRSQSKSKKHTRKKRRSKLRRINNKQ